VVISVPCCLESASLKLSQLSNRIYMESFLFSLRKKILLKKDLLEAHGHDLKGLYGIRDFETFDDRYTAPTARATRRSARRTSRTASGSTAPPSR
jgi:predicted alpha/beta-fold hydrolase